MKLLIILAGLLVSFSSFAHSTLVSSIPADGDVLTASPHHMELRYSEPVLLTQFVIRNSEGDAVATDFTAGRERQEQFHIMPGSDLGEGDFTIEWVVMSADGHRVSGDIEFRVES